MGEAFLSVHYSGGDSLPDDITKWLETNQILPADEGRDFSYIEGGKQHESAGGLFSGKH